jgi:hypothetical protein
MTTIFIFLFAVLVSCGRVYPQSNHELDSIFNSNFFVLDSVATGTKKQYQLTAKQTSFLYLINGWVDAKTSFNHSNGIIFDKKNVKTWRSWYSKNSNKIDREEFYKALQILFTFSTTGTVPESDLDYLEELNKKYRSL